MILYDTMKSTTNDTIVSDRIEARENTDELYNWNGNIFRRNIIRNI